MGCMNTKYKNYDIFIPLKICSFCADMKNTFSQKNNINRIIEYFFSDGNGYKIDVMCLQNINSMEIYSEIIKCFRTEVKRLNSKPNIEREIMLYYYPYDDLEKDETDDTDSECETWSLDDKTTDDESLYGKLIISRYKSVVYMEGNRYEKPRLSGFDGSLNFNTFENQKSNKIQVVNINVNSVIVSIYNVDFNYFTNNVDLIRATDSILQLIKMNNTEVKMNCTNDNINSRNIHIICGNMGVTEIKNNAMSKSYIRLLKKLNIIDTLRYVAEFRNKNLLTDVYSTNIFVTRNNFVMFRSENLKKLDDNEHSSHVLYRDHGIVSVDAHVNRNFEDLFLNFPTVVMILIKMDWVNTCPTSDIDYDEAVEYKTYKNIELSRDAIRNIIMADSDEDNSDDNNNMDRYDESSSDSSITIGSIEIED